MNGSYLWISKVWNKRYSIVLVELILINVFVFWIENFVDFVILYVMLIVLDEVVLFVMMWSFGFVVVVILKLVIYFFFENV